jgi:hypothetical protein
LAEGKFVLFIGDDIFLAPNACELHLQAHQQIAKDGPHPERALLDGNNLPSADCQLQSTILGYTTWDPACGITPVMQWLETSGWQFAYGNISNSANCYLPTAIQHWYTYTSHISLPTSLAKKIQFDEQLCTYGWEDIEWGWRLAQAHVPLYYLPTATALHHHHLEVRDSLERIKKIGASARAVQALHPELQLMPRGLRLLKQQILSVLPTMAGQHAEAFLDGLGQKK